MVKTPAVDRLTEIRDVLKKLLERFKPGGNNSIWDGFKSFTKSINNFFEAPKIQAAENTASESGADTIRETVSETIRQTISPGQTIAAPLERPASKQSPTKEIVEKETTKESSKESTKETKESKKESKKDSTKDSKKDSSNSLKVYTGLREFTSSVKSIFNSSTIKEFFSSAKGIFTGIHTAGKSASSLMLPDSQKYPQQSTSQPVGGSNSTKTKNESTTENKESHHRTERTISKVVSDAIRSISRRVTGTVTEVPATAARGAGAAAGATEAGGAAASGGAGAAGGAAEAAGGAIPALASNPVGWVVLAVAAIAAVVVAMVALPFIIKKFGESLLESQRNLAESSGKMAQVFAKKDVADTMRDQRIGDATAGSAGGLSDALIRLEDRIEPFTIIVTDFLNGVMTGFVDFATGILSGIIDALNMIITGINKLIPGPDILRKIEIHTRPREEMSDMSNLIKDWANAGKAYHSGPAHGATGRPVPGLT